MIYYFKEGSNDPLFFDEKDNFMNVVNDAISRHENLLGQEVVMRGFTIGVCNSINEYHGRICE